MAANNATHTAVTAPTNIPPESSKYSYESLNKLHIESENDPFTEDRYRQFYRYCPHDTRTVLDIGCNTGRGGRVLHNLNSQLKITGLDVVEDRLNTLPRDIYANATLGSSTSMPFDDQSFDVVMAGEFVEHLYPGDVEATLAEIFRVLRFRGKILLTTPNPNDIKRRLNGGTILGGAHVSQHCPDSLKMRLKMAGFNRVKVLGSGKVSRYLGYHFPLLSIYGSYLAIGEKY